MMRMFNGTSMTIVTVVERIFFSLILTDLCIFKEDNIRSKPTECLFLRINNKILIFNLKIFKEKK